MLSGSFVWTKSGRQPKSLSSRITFLSVQFHTRTISSRTSLSSCSNDNLPWKPYWFWSLSGAGASRVAMNFSNYCFTWYNTLKLCCWAHDSVGGWLSIGDVFYAGLHTLFVQICTMSSIHWNQKLGPCTVSEFATRWDLRKAIWNVNQQVYR